MAPLTPGADTGQHRALPEHDRIGRSALGRTPDQGSAPIGPDQLGAKAPGLFEDRTLRPITEIMPTTGNFRSKLLELLGLVDYLKIPRQGPRKLARSLLSLDAPLSTKCKSSR